ncbi:MAG: MucB/RseB C-terminal domain-containing protein [Pseudomonadota bacterium]
MSTLVVGLMTAQLGAAEPPAELLQRMHDATRMLTYDGIFIYQRGPSIETMRIMHRYDSGVETERLISLSGPRREIIRDGERVTCVFADDQEVMVEKNPSQKVLGLEFTQPIDKLATFYGFSSAGQDRIADRAAQVVAVNPKTPDRYTYKIWIDEQTGLLLKSVIIGGADEVLEQLQFTQIQVVDSMADAMLQPEIVGSGFTWRFDASADETGDQSDMGWAPNWMPAGFELQDENIETMATSEMPVSHAVYSDGLAMVSVFVEKLMDNGDSMEGHSSMGAVNAFSRVDGEHQITVVGEIPLPTVRQIAASVAYEE